MRCVVRNIWLAMVLVGATTLACNAATGGGTAVAEDTTSDAQLADSGTDAVTATDADTNDAAPDAFSVPWTEFRLTTGGFCPTDCSQAWVVSPDGAVAMKKSGVTSNGQLNAADLSTLHATLDTPGFLAKMKDGFTCDPPPTDIGYAFSYALSGVKYDQDVTGCQISGGLDNALVHGLTKLLMAY